MAALLLLVYVVLQRLAELVHARRNTRRLMAQGAVEIGAAHYPTMVALHAAWLAANAVWVAAHAPPLDPLFATLYLLVQPLRFWAIASLGRYWTTRIVTLPGAPLVARGPYRLVRHPNYAVVVLEIALLPLAFGAWEIALAFSVLNAAMLWVRIGAENAALAARRSAPT
jgi:methyltransferase